ncbi:sarcoplasmic calcium-binding protein [Schistocerca piceifrons]|uniref:sarcoplasmic calcium-binding protein n=1 Tax=Schistocerca piceifrons TaxID=274613 RepID=UPI001F5ED591|nr:sarcoplasmic calcium-binding protein [Schistocerca piceifrons]
MASFLVRSGVRAVLEAAASAGVVTPRRLVLEQQRLFSKSFPARLYRKEAAGRPSALERHLSDSESDSDSDDEHRPREKGNTEFWRRKIRTFHGLIDLNHDGVVSMDDFNILADRFINLGHLTKKQEEEFRAALQVVWEEQWGIAHPYNLVTTEQYLENMHHVINDKSLKRKSHHFLSHLFKAIDKDKSGDISVEEFKLFFQCLNLGPEKAIESFTAIDLNHDGHLSDEEFIRLGREYFITEDESKPSKYFWGPLIKP